jgi:hypothetical protein
MYLHQAARARLARSTALAHERQRVTFEPQATPAQQTESQDSGTVLKIKPKRRVSLGFAVDVETGEVVEGVTAKRQSQRKHTVMNTSETVNRLKKSEAKRVRALLSVEHSPLNQLPQPGSGRPQANQKCNTCIYPG